MVKPVGILLFTHPDTIKVYRENTTNYSFDNKKGGGIKKVISELEVPYEFCSHSTMGNYDDVICSLTSFNDVLNLVINVPNNLKNTRIHIGGPACNNIRPIIPYIYSANFGRCDEGKINKILNHEPLKSVWYKDEDPDFSGEYEVDTSSVKGLGDNERSFGCPQKCAFCFYSHWNGYRTKGKDSHYGSGIEYEEDFFQCLDWPKIDKSRYGLTALDGVTEETRSRVHKKITRQDIKDTLLRSNEIESEKGFRLKIYLIVGYPWENKDELDKFDLPIIFKEIEDNLINKFTVRLQISHFIPFQKTPLWNVPFNFYNYRKWAKSHPRLYDSQKVRVFSGVGNPSPALAGTSTILQRAWNDDTDVIRLLATKKFRRMKVSQQLSIMRRNFNRFFVEQNVETIKNIITPNKYDKIIWRDKNK